MSITSSVGLVGLDHPPARTEQRTGSNDMVAGAGRAKQRGRHRSHSGRRGARIFGAFQQAHALFEHVDGRVGVTRIDEARRLALEARLGGLGGIVDEALGQE
jgi:hypothetical protein